MHCRMGMSRSGGAVVAYGELSSGGESKGEGMKEAGLTEGSDEVCGVSSGGGIGLC